MTCRWGRHAAQRSSLTQTELTVSMCFGREYSRTARSEPRDGVRLLLLATAALQGRSTSRRVDFGSLASAPGGSATRPSI